MVRECTLARTRNAAAAAARTCHKLGGGELGSPHLQRLRAVSVARRLCAGHGVRLWRRRGFATGGFVLRQPWARAPRRRRSSAAGGARASSRAAERARKKWRRDAAAALQSPAVPPAKQICQLSSSQLAAVASCPNRGKGHHTTIMPWHRRMPATSSAQLLLRASTCAVGAQRRHCSGRRHCSARGARFHACMWPHARSALRPNSASRRTARRTCGSCRTPALQATRAEGWQQRGVAACRAMKRLRRCKHDANRTAARVHHLRWRACPMRPA
jgi:hypothetical protein